ncbi:hypothetical protein CDD83_7386 [Cordyceps sp. RAO-2017]|nr:hypothetical protein CDD83_7386 [Cordyceps sp. RAO-2017]
MMGSSICSARSLAATLKRASTSKVPGYRPGRGRWLGCIRDRVGPLLIPTRHWSNPEPALHNVPCLGLGPSVQYRSTDVHTTCRRAGKVPRQVGEPGGSVSTGSTERTCMERLPPPRAVPRYLGSVREGRRGLPETAVSSRRATVQSIVFVHGLPVYYYQSITNARLSKDYPRHADRLPPIRTTCHSLSASLTSSSPLAVIHGRSIGHARLNASAAAATTHSLLHSRPPNHNGCLPVAGHLPGPVAQPSGLHAPRRSVARGQQGGAGLALERTRVPLPVHDEGYPSGDFSQPRNFGRRYLCAKATLGQGHLMGASAAAGPNKRNHRPSGLPPS